MTWIDSPAWHWLTRLGEAQILLPAALLAIAAMLRQPQGVPLASRWLVLLALAVGLTTASKVAFIGWGIGSQALDFTGVSGHAMFAAAVYPLLLGALAPQALRVPAVAAGAALALLVGVSRIPVQAHSVSEVVAGLLLGGAVSVLVLLRVPLRARLSPWLAPLAALWLALMPGVAPPSQSHAMVTRLALALSGHEVPHTRHEMHARLRS